MNDRQEKILDIIINKSIETQEELTSELKKEGFDVTQATVSRDIRKMKLTKVADFSGHRSRHRPESGAHLLPCHELLLQRRQGPGRDFCLGA